MKHHLTRRNVLLLCTILILLAILLVSAVQLVQGLSRVRNQSAMEYASKTIVRDGVSYFPRQDITVIMVIGVDRFGPMAGSGYQENSGDADLVSLLVFDEQARAIQLLSLNRDTMVEMPVLSITGKPAGTKYAQLTLAYNEGSGLEDSCENVKKTVSNLLGGVQIDYYIAMNMDAIAILNDAVGGVPVTVTEDFSLVDPTIHMGQMVLNGSQALNYVRARSGVGDQLNLSRMERQNAYIRGLQQALWDGLKKDAGLLRDLYQDTADYIVTDCSLTTLNTLLNRYDGYTIGEFISLKGENVLENQFMAFYPDLQALDDLILQRLYQRKNTN